VSKAINGLLEHIAKLDTRIAELEGSHSANAGSVTGIDENEGDASEKRADC
jgi:hypothetical protein